MVAESDFDALCGAIDEGDNSALFALADWLEDQGNPLAENLRFATNFSPVVTMTEDGHGRLYGWFRGNKDGSWSSSGTIKKDIFDRLDGGIIDAPTSGAYRWYHNRSAAYIALATSLSTQPQVVK